MTGGCLSRRCMLDLGLTAAGAIVLPSPGNAASSRMAGPQLGDVFVSVANRRAVLTPDALRAGAAPILAWPMEPAGRLIRDGSRFNQVLLLRLPRTGTAPQSARVIAFSAICPHAGCIVSSWIGSRDVLLCPCHGSEYDPAAGGAVVAGPAPIPLPGLPLRITPETIMVAGPFSAVIGGHTGRTD